MAEVLRSTVLEGFQHGFSTREELPVAEVAPQAQLLRLWQIHSADVVAATEPWNEAPRADAMVTDRPGLALGIVTADCAPVLLADPEAGVIGAAHAGWRGAAGGVIANTVAAMCKLGALPERILAAIGPTIAQESYEVDAAFRDRFESGDEDFFTPGRDGHWQFDLPAYVAQRLRLAGVGRIDDLAQDTYADPARFFSYRRATHSGKETGGRQVSMIALG